MDRANLLDCAGVCAAASAATLVVFSWTSSENSLIGNHFVFFVSDCSFLNLMVFIAVLGGVLDSLPATFTGCNGVLFAGPCGAYSIFPGQAVFPAPPLAVDMHRNPYLLPPRPTALDSGLMKGAEVRENVQSAARAPMHLTHLCCDGRSS